MAIIITEGDINKIIQNKIRNDMDDFKTKFYGDIIKIFAIFVTIVTFILFTINQIPLLVQEDNDWLTNLSNIASVLIPLMIVLLILLYGVGRITKTNNK